MSQLMSSPTEDSVPTRYSLLSRLKNREDQESWRDFFDTYWRLIYSVAVKAGLTESEAQDVVQETVISVARDIHKFKRDRKLGSFKGWLRNVTKWRIADQFRKREPSMWRKSEPGPREFQSTDVADLPDTSQAALEAAWDEEWRANLLEAAAERVKRRVKEEHYQMFDLYAVRGWPVQKVARMLGVSTGRVYLAKYRVAALIKKEVCMMEKKWY
jgi:RNA polymerase sigma factor (sigma-70 family)